MGSCSKMYYPFLFSSGHSKSRLDFKQDKRKYNLCLWIKFSKFSQPGSFLATCTNPSWEKLHRRRLKLRLRECTECTTARSGQDTAVIPSLPEEEVASGRCYSEDRRFLSRTFVLNNWEGILMVIYSDLEKDFKILFLEWRIWDEFADCQNDFPANLDETCYAELRAVQEWKIHFLCLGLIFQISTLIYSLESFSVIILFGRLLPYWQSQLQLVNER